MTPVCKVIDLESRREPPACTRATARAALELEMQRRRRRELVQDVAGGVAAFLIVLGLCWWFS